MFFLLVVRFPCLNRDQFFTSKLAVIRDKRSRGNESRLYFSLHSEKKRSLKGLKKDFLQPCHVPSCRQRGLLSDCADAQADLSLRWAHMSEGMFSSVAAHIFSEHLFTRCVNRSIFRHRIFISLEITMDRRCYRALIDGFCFVSIYY